MDKQQRYDELYLDIAQRISEMSHDTDKKVGAVIVKDNNILAFGFNGMPPGPVLRAYIPYERDILREPHDKRIDYSPYFSIINYLNL